MCLLWGVGIGKTSQNPSDSLTQLNTYHSFGAMAGLNPFADMSLNQNDPNVVCLFNPFIVAIVCANLQKKDAIGDEQPSVSPANVSNDV